LLKRAFARSFGLFALTLLSALSLLAAACGTSASTPPGGRGRGGGGPAPVTTAVVQQKDVPVDIPSIGNVEASTTISVRSQVTGQLLEVQFKEGDFVKKGDRLFTIDPRPFQAALEQTQAILTQDEALLKQAEAALARDAANAEYQQLAAERQAQLQSRGIISKDMMQQARAAADATAAAVNADKAAVESARAQVASQTAAVNNSKVQLGYTAINSPIDGRTGNLAVRAGNLVTANAMELTTIAQVQPVFVTFTVPAQHLPALKGQNAKNLLVSATPQAADAKPLTGKLVFFDNAVDVSTDTIKLKATFDNVDHIMWPGQFARVTLRVATLPNATVVPSQAVQTSQDGEYVFVVTPASTAEQRPIVTGQRVDEETVVVQKGLKAGETIVTEGQLRIEPGARIQTADNRGGPGRGKGAPGGAGGGKGPQQGGGGQAQGQSQGRSS
jgi:multidrug efflux system membrane fusion protein